MQRRIRLLLVLCLVFFVGVTPTAIGQPAGERPAYDDVFGVTPTSYSAPGGAYHTSTIDLAFDGDVETHWETGTPNSPTYDNVVNVEFTPSQIDRVVYYPRVHGAPNKGYPTGVEIYAASSPTGSLTKIHTGRYAPADGPLTISFEPRTIAKLRFVFTEADQNWAAAGEFKFYAPDPFAAQVDALFTDGTFSGLEPGVTSTQVEALYTDSLTHPDAGLTTKLEIARSLLDGANLSGEIITLDRPGDIQAYTRETLRMSNFGSNLVTTGIAASPGEQITVYADVAAGEPMPRIVFTQHQGIYTNWKASFSLHPGQNILTVPALDNPSNVTPGGPIYLENPYTADQQSVAPRIRIDGGYDFPLFVSGDDVEPFLTEIRAYQAKRASDPDRYADIVEIANDWITALGTLGNAQVFLDGRDPQVALDVLGDRYANLVAYSGVTTLDPVRTGPDVTRAPHQMVRIMTMPEAGFYAFAAGDHTGFFEETMAEYFAGRNWGWAIAHELGHHLDARGAAWPEVSNNMWANYIQLVVQGWEDRITPAQYDTFFSNNVGASYRDAGPVYDLMMFWQLHMYDPQYWAKYHLAHREHIFDQLTETERIVALSSYALGFDLTEHFDRHHYFSQRGLTEAGRSGVIANIRHALTAAGIPESNVPTWYLWTKAVTTDEAFADTTAPVISSVTPVGQSAVIDIKDDPARSGALLGYEVLMDGEVVAFTRTHSATVPLPADTHSYAVRAYDVHLAATEVSEPVVSTPGAPYLALTGSTVLPVGSTADDLLAAVTGFTAQGETAQVSFDRSAIDLTKSGSYAVEMTVTDGARTSSRTIDVEVVPARTYLSDLEPVSAEVGWESLGVDRKIETDTPISLGLLNGTEHSYSKGLVAHAPSKLVYDLSEMNPGYFEAYIGIDGAVRTRPGNVSYTVMADDEVIYTADLVTASMAPIHILLDISGARTLTLFTGTNGPAEADHSAWAMASVSEARPAPVTPVAPTLVPGTCTMAPVVTIPSQAGVTFTIGGNEVAGTVRLAEDQAVTIQAHPATGFVLEGTSSWTLTGTVTCAPGPTPDPTPTPVPENGNLFFVANSWSTKVADAVFAFGKAGDEVLVGDWNGDEMDTIGLRRGNTIFLNNTLSGGNADIEFTFGKAGDELVIGDWDGDGIDTIGVRRGNRFFVKNSFTSGNADVEFTFGRVGDEVLVGDWDGDGKDSIAVRRGNQYFIHNSLESGWATQSFTYGSPTDGIFVGDWDGDGLDTIALRRSATFIIKNSLGAGPADLSIQYGRVDDVAFVGDWDGNGTDTPTVNRFVR